MDPLRPASHALPLSECSEDEEPLLLLPESELLDLAFSLFTPGLLGVGDLERRLAGDLDSLPLTGDLDLECERDLER